MWSLFSCFTSRCPSFGIEKETEIVVTSKAGGKCGFSKAVPFGAAVTQKSLGICDDVQKLHRLPSYGVSSILTETETCASEKDVDAGFRASLPPAPDSYNYSETTENNHGVPYFTGRYADIRSLLDYTWYRKYSVERVDLQDRIIDRLFSEITLWPDSMLPWVVFTAGAPAVGKGYVMKWMADNGCLPLEGCTVIDPDVIRRTMPEWAGYVKFNPSGALDLTQKEATCIAEIMGFKAFRERNNVIFDGSLQDVVWYKDGFKELRKRFPGVRIMVLHIVADTDEIIHRAEVRAQDTGLELPRQTLFQSLQDVPQSVSQLAPFADFCCRVRNRQGREPELEREPSARSPSANTPLTWEVVKGLWRALDVDGDGELSKAEVETAIAQGLLTVDVLNTMDGDGDGKISAQDFETARAKARRAGSKRYK